MNTWYFWKTHISATNRHKKECLRCLWKNSSEPTNQSSKVITLFEFKEDICRMLLKWYLLTYPHNTTPHSSRRRGQQFYETVLNRSPLPINVVRQLQLCALVRTFEKDFLSTNTAYIGDKECRYFYIPAFLGTQWRLLNAINCNIHIRTIHLGFVFTVIEITVHV